MNRFRNAKSGIAAFVAKKSPEQQAMKRTAVNSTLTIDEIRASPVFNHPEKWINKRRVLSSSERIQSYPDLQQDFLAKKLSSPSRHSRSTKLSFPRDYLLGFTSVKDTETSSDEAKLAPLFENQLSRGSKYAALDHLSVSHLRVMNENESVPSFLLHEKFKNENLTNQRVLQGTDMIFYLKYLNDLKASIGAISSLLESSSQREHGETGTGLENILILSFETPTIRSIYLNVDPYSQNMVMPALNLPYILHNEGDVYADIKDLFFIEKKYDVLDSLVIIKNPSVEEQRFAECLSRYALYEERILFEQTADL